MIENAPAAAVGATVSALGVKKLETKIRAWLSGFSMSLFLADDAINFIEHIFNFTVSKGGAVFFIALFGAAMLEKLLFIINTFKLR